MLLHWDGLRTLPLDRVTEGKGLPEATIALPSVQAYADNDWFYPIINGVPRLMIEAVIDYEGFLSKYITNFKERKEILFTKYAGLINHAYKKNYHTKQSFTQEWAIFNPEKDKTWNASEQKMLERFFTETSETKSSLQNKIVFDAGCGNGLLNKFIDNGSQVIS